MKVSELSGALLDEWVARAEGYTIGELEGAPGSRCAGKNGYCVGTISSVTALTMLANGTYWPSRDWKQGGPIIDANAIGFHPISDAEWMAEEHMTAHTGRGPTPLIAAMRAYVASKFGDEVADEEAA